VVAAFEEAIARVHGGTPATPPRAATWAPTSNWVQQAYPTLTYFHEADKGGHFAAWEQPERFATEIRAAFRPLR
jgi:pimeloyl-ACP methyl ester carboxylesterase